jgi:hypothetical protein
MYVNQSWYVTSQDENDFIRLLMVLGKATLSVAGLPLVNNCKLFGTNLALSALQYHVNTWVALDVFQLFLEAVEGKLIQITKQKVADLSPLCT